MGADDVIIALFSVCCTKLNHKLVVQLKTGVD